MAWLQPEIFDFVFFHWLTFVRLVFPLLALLLFLHAVRTRVSDGVASVLVASVVYGCYFLTVLPVMSIHLRYLIPVYPPIAIVAAVSLGRCIEAQQILSLRLKACLVGFALLLVLTPASEFPKMKRESLGIYEAHAGYRRLALALEGLPRLSIAVSEVGHLPYLTDSRILDMSGLNDRFVAWHRFKDPDMSRSFADYLANGFGWPDVYIEPPSEYEYARTANQPEVARRYDRVVAFGLDVFVLRDAMVRDMIVGRLQAAVPTE
ncbi:MAG: hypothetical protein ABI051_00570 [Vicinamibacterales bacterium]